MFNLQTYILHYIYIIGALDEHFDKYVHLTNYITSVRKPYWFKYLGIKIFGFEKKWK